MKPEAAKPKGIGIEVLGIILGSAVLGAVAGVSVLRAMQGGVETISTAGLLGFTLTTGLSVTAIILAISSMAHVRAAGRDLDVSQAALAAQTAAAIERMESSVRRIGGELSDTICGNFEILIGEVLENLPTRDILRADVSEAVERALADVRITVGKQAKVDEAPAAGPEPEILIEEASVAVVPESSTDQMREKADKKYGEFKDIVLLGVANYPGVIARKVGEGQYRTEGDKLADGVFVIQNEKVAVCTFCTISAIADRFLGETGDSFIGFLKSLFNELKRGHFTRIFLVFDGQLTNTSLYAKALNGLSGRIDADTFSRFELFEGTPDIVIPELTERVSQLMEEKPAIEEDVPELSFHRQAGG